MPQELREEGVSRMDGVCTRSKPHKLLDRGKDRKVDHLVCSLSCPRWSILWRGGHKSLAEKGGPERSKTAETMREVSGVRGEKGERSGRWREV